MTKPKPKCVFDKTFETLEKWLMSVTNLHFHKTVYNIGGKITESCIIYVVIKNRNLWFWEELKQINQRTPKRTLQTKLNLANKYGI